jgi:glutathione S-transferase
VAWLLEELEIPYGVEKYIIGDKRLRQPEFRKLHPLGRVPLLEDDGVIMFESGAIIDYLLTRYDGGRLKPQSSDTNFPEYLQWFHFSEGMIMPPINTLVVETVLLPPERSNQVNIDRAKKLLGLILDVVNEKLSNEIYLAGEFSAADIMTGHAVIMASKYGIDFSDKVNLLTYKDRLLQRPSLKIAWSL